MTPSSPQDPTNSERAWMSRKDHLRKLIESHTRRLEILEERRAQYGLDTPPAVLTEIEDIRTALAELQAELATLAEETTSAPPTAVDTSRGIHSKFRPAAGPQLYGDLTPGPATLIGLNEIPQPPARPVSDLAPAAANAPDSPRQVSDALTSEVSGILADELLASAAFEETLMAIEAERQRLATLLENNLTTPLRLLLAQSNALEQYLRANPAAHSAVFMLTTLARQALQHVQDLIADLHPTVLETLGLEQALEMLANQKMRAHGLQITLAFERSSQRLPPRVELALFRVAQDLLDRAINQARASHVLVQLNRRDDHLILTLTDNGVGVTDETTLQSLRRQLEPVGGTVKAGAGYQGSFEVVIILNIKDLAALNASEMDLLQLLAEERKR